VFVWDKIWIPELAPPERVLGEAAERLWEWAGSPALSSAA
jgi:hypothetical protein